MNETLRSILQSEPIKHIFNLAIPILFNKITSNMDDESIKKSEILYKKSEIPDKESEIPDKESEIPDKFFKYKINDVFKEILGIEINGNPQDFYKNLNKASDKHFDVPHDSLEKDLQIILKEKSTLISGRQGSGKSYYAKAMINYIEHNSDSENKNYITSYVKTWDYDYVNNPLLLFMKKIWSSNILKEEHNETLWLLIWSYKNELNKSGYPEHILIDLIKLFFTKCKVNKNKKLILFIDELERCAPAFASELLETITTYAGVECSIDDHACAWDTNSPELFINNVSVVYIFDKEFLSKGLMKHFGQLPDDNNVSNSFFNKYIKYEIIKEKITWKQLRSQLRKHGVFQLDSPIGSDIYLKNRIINTGKIDWREMEKVAYKLKKTNLIKKINETYHWDFIKRGKEPFGLHLQFWLELVLTHKLLVNFLISFGIEISTDIAIQKKEIAQNHINIIKSKNINYEKFINALEYVADNHGYFEIEYCLDNSLKYNSKSTIESK